MSVDVNLASRLKLGTGKQTNQLVEHRTRAQLEGIGVVDDGVAAHHHLQLGCRYDHFFQRHLLLHAYLVHQYLAKRVARVPVLRVFEVDVLVGGVIAVVLKLHDVFARGLDVAIHLPPTETLCREGLHYCAVHAHERHSCGIEIFLRKRISDESVYMILLGKSQRGCEDKNK